MATHNKLFEVEKQIKEGIMCLCQEIVNEGNGKAYPENQEIWDSIQEKSEYLSGLIKEHR